MTSTLTADAIARFLQANPDFFQQHAEVFAELRVPHPHEARAISLGERQILTLRARGKELEWKLATLVHNAAGNEKINRRLIDWCAALLAEPDPAQLPALIESGLAGMFDVPLATLRLWDLPGLPPEASQAEVLDESVHRQASQLTRPDCGPFEGAPAVDWLTPAPVSLALVPLRNPEGETFGLLALGADDAERYTSDMSTDFLVVIGQLASAALSRLANAPSTDGQPKVPPLPDQEAP